MGKRSRILMVSENGLYPDYFGGMEIRGRDLVTHLQETYDIALLTKSALTAPDGSVAPLQIPTTGTWGRPSGRGRMLRSVWNYPLVQSGRRRLKKSLSTLQPDMLFLHRFCSLHPVVVHDLLHSGRPVLARFGDQHGALFESFASGSKARRVAFRLGPLAPRARDRITLVFNCRYLRQFYAPLFRGYARQFIVYDGVDIRRFHRAAKLPDPPRFAFLGRVDPGKGFLDFCRAMALLPRALVGGIEIIGDGPQLRDGLQLLRASDRYDLVRGAGVSHHDDVPERLRTASVLVHPSVDEGMPAAVFEAMATGLAVVANTVGGIPEIIRHGETGLLTAPGDLAGLVASCRQLAEDADLRQRLGANARALVATHYDVSRSFAAFADLVATTIGCVGFTGHLQQSHWVPAG